VTGRIVCRFVALYAGSVVFGEGLPNRLEVDVSGDPAVSKADAVDPVTVQTLSELAAAFQRLRGSRSYAQLDKAVNANHSRGGPRVLPPSTLNNLLHGKSVPTRETVETFLAACGLDMKSQQPWLAAWERVATAHLRRPAGAVRVREARPRLLGVHASIQVDSVATDLPAYVPRDLDADLRTAVAGAAATGGFVVLVGGSSVGKTRALFEAVRAVVPEWWLVHPDPADADVLAALAMASTPRTVVWLDELQRYLDTPDGLSAGLVRRLIAAGAVLVATIWPNEYARRTGSRMPDQPDTHVNEREVLQLGLSIDVPDTFSVAERRRAQALASDQRIRIALGSRDVGFTQVLAAGPELVRWWENAADPYGKAVITAALDARRVGVQAPITRDFLTAAAPAYLAPVQQASASTDWLDRALAYATTNLHGAASTLAPVPTGMGQISGYTPADYLHQHALDVRRTIHLPGVAWQALVDHHHPDDTGRLADNAERRGQAHAATALYRRAADTGDTLATHRLVALLAEQDSVDELRERANAGDDHATMRLAETLARQDRLDELRDRASIGDRHSAYWLADLLAGHGHVDEAVVVLRRRADAGDWFPLNRLVSLLTAQGHVDEAVAVLRHHADAGEPFAAERLAEQLAEQGDIEELRERADAGDRNAAGRLADLLVQRGRVDELRRRAHAGDGIAEHRLFFLLAEQGHLDDAVSELRRRARMGNGTAAGQLVDLLAEHDRVDELRQLIHERRGRPFGEYAASRLADLLAERGQIDELRQFVDELRWWADQASEDARRCLADLLVEQGDVDELRRRANNFDEQADEGLTDLLAKQGRIDELRERAIIGNEYAEERLIDLLSEQGRLEMLAEEVAAGTLGAAEALRRLSGRGLP